MKGSGTISSCHLTSQTERLRPREELLSLAKTLRDLTLAPHCRAYDIIPGVVGTEWDFFLKEGVTGFLLRAFLPRLHLLLLFKTFRYTYAFWCVHTCVCVCRCEGQRTTYSLLLPYTSQRSNLGQQAWLHLHPLSHLAVPAVTSRSESLTRVTVQCTRTVLSKLVRTQSWRALTMELAVVQFWKIACRLPTRFNMLLLSYCVIQQLCIPAFFFFT